MAAAASAGTITQGTTATELVNNTTGCTKFLVGVKSGSAQDGLVQVVGLHSSTEWFLIIKGKEYIFENGPQGIKRVNAKGSGGSADFYFGVISQRQSSDNC